MNADWTRQEVTLIIADYFSMLGKELRMEPLNKTQHRSLLLSQLTGRNHGAIEFKHQNISAALSLMGLPFISGYKPRYNFQREMIVSVIQEYLAASPQLKNTFASFAEASPETKENVSFKNWKVAAPKAQPKENKTPDQGTNSKQNYPNIKRRRSFQRYIRRKHHTGITHQYGNVRNKRTD